MALGGFLQGAGALSQGLQYAPYLDTLRQLATMLQRPQAQQQQAMSGIGNLLSPGGLNQLGGGQGGGGGLGSGGRGGGGLGGGSGLNTLALLGLLGGGGLSAPSAGSGVGGIFGALNSLYGNGNGA